MGEEVPKSYLPGVGQLARDSVCAINYHAFIFYSSALPPPSPKSKTLGNKCICLHKNKILASVRVLEFWFYISFTVYIFFIMNGLPRNTIFPFDA